MIRTVTDPNHGWRRVFAFLPVTFGDTFVWLDWYWRRWGGEFYECTLDDPRQRDR